MNLRSKKSIPRAGSPAGTAIWSIGLFADFIAQWWVVLVVGLLVSASVMNSFALMRVNANMAVLRQELRAMQTMQQAQQESGQQSQPKTPESLSNEVSPAR